MIKICINLPVGRKVGEVTVVRKTVISVGKCSQGGGASSPVAQGAKWIGFGHWGKQVDTESGGS